MDRQRFILAHAIARQRALRAVSEAPDGFHVVIEPPHRDLSINAALHASIGEVAELIEWAGRKWDIETWKRLLVAAWCRANHEPVMMLPALDGQGVDIVFRRTSQMTQAEVHDLLAFIDAWKAERPEFQQSVEEQR